MKVQRFLTLASLSALLLPATPVFAAPTLSAITIGAQAPASAIPGDSVKYQLTVCRAGSGSLDAYLSMIGLPVAVLATFDPVVVRFHSNSPATLGATLILSTSTSMAAGTYPFTVVARHGSSSKFQQTQGVLTLGNSPRVQIQPLLLIESGPEGQMRLSGSTAPGQVLSIEATTDLGSGVWTTLSTNTADFSGVFEFIDVDATNFWSRFYRTSSPY
jgi:hypothetical protein